MKYRVNVRWEVNLSSDWESIPLEDLDCETVEEWESLSDGEKEDRLQNALNELPERVHIVVDKWK